MKGPIIDCFFFLFKKKKTTSFFFFYKLHRAYEVHAFDSFPLHFIQFKKKKKQTNKKKYYSLLFVDSAVSCTRLSYIIDFRSQTVCFLLSLFLPARKHFPPSRKLLLAPFSHHPHPTPSLTHLTPPLPLPHLLF